MSSFIRRFLCKGDKYVWYKNIKGMTSLREDVSLWKKFPHTYQYHSVGNA